jgi:acetolactate synthase I/II/III large subunit
VNGADVLVRCLLDRGVQFVSTLSGNGMDPFYEACRQAGLRLVDFRNEQAAAFAADTVARLEKRLAVCAVNATVGHANALVGLVNAAFAGSPVLLISGAAPHSHADLGRFQDFDQVPLAAPICKYARAVDRADRIPFYVHEACSRAVAGRPGPVHLTIPSDVLSAPVEDATGWPATEASGAVQPQAAPSPQALHEAIKLLSEAKRPVIVAGSGVYFAGGEQALHDLAAKLDIPIVIPIWDQGTVSRPTSQFVGFIGAAYGGPRLLPDADVLLLAGARIDYRTGFGQPPGVSPDVRVIRVDIEPSELVQGRAADVAILADPASALAALADEAHRSGGEPHTEWREEAARRWRAFRSPWLADAPAAPPLTGRHIVEGIRPLLDEDLLFLMDGGNIGQWVHMALGDRYPPQWLTCGPSGVVGWGVAGAVAAKLSRPETRVLLLAGDGAIGFNLMELETAVRHNTPFVSVVADDREWGSVVTGQERTYGPEGVTASRLGHVAYDQVACGLGAAGVRVSTSAELTSAIQQGFLADTPTLIHVPITGSAPQGGDAS